jgi:molybdopterin adenylyltransferase
MAAIHEEHRAQGPACARCAVVTVSDTRNLENDMGGRTMIDLLEAAGHVVVCREIIPDEPARMRPLIESYRDRDDVDVILMTGGTGIASRDQTYETISGLLSKPLPGYGEVFRMLSYQEIGAAAILSRAVGGLIGHKVLLTMPGSPAGVRLAMEKIVISQLPHLLREARR